MSPPPPFPLSIVASCQPPHAFVSPAARVLHHTSGPGQPQVTVPWDSLTGRLDCSQIRGYMISAPLASGSFSNSGILQKQGGHYSTYTSLCFICLVVYTVLLKAISLGAQNKSKWALSAGRHIPSPHEDASSLLPLPRGIDTKTSCKE